MSEYPLTEVAPTERETPLVLVVDSDNVICGMLKKALLGNEYEVIEACNGAEAVESFRDARPDMVLMNALMPVMNGFEACEAMRGIDAEPGVPIIMLTGLDDLSSVDRAFEAGASDFITKPIDWSLFNQRIRYALRCRRLDFALRKKHHRVRYASRAARLGYWEWDLKTGCFHIPAEAQAMLGIELKDDAVLDDLLAFVAADEKDRVRQAFIDAAESGNNFAMEYRMTGGHKECPVYQLGEVIDDDDGKPAQVRGSIQDIGAFKRTDDLILHQAYHDLLTDLPNQALLKERLDHALKVAEHAHARVAVILLDIDRFQSINQSLGHEAGNELLVEFAGLLNRFVQEGDTVSRISGDEFALLLESIYDLEEINDVIRRIRGALKDNAFDIAGEQVYVTVGMGVAIYPDDEMDADHLMRSANAAMRKAKSLGGDQSFFYTSGMNRRIHDRLRLEGDLRQALEEHRLELYYQPQVDVETRRIVSVEALVRWHHERHGVISPIRFIPLAEETGLIQPLGQWALREAIKQTSAWHAKNHKLICGINLSAKQFRQQELVGSVRDLLQEFNLPPQYIDLEITETVAIQDAENSIRKMHELKALGVNLSMDDFGSGYSSLSYLHRFPLDVLKIDRSFVKDIKEQGEDGAIARAVIAMARSMNLEVIAEGVENETQFEFLKAHGCHRVQGFLVSKPVTAGELEKLL